ncbi:G-type lectin S-receptor-like serine/threonine-protein kinase At5g35370 [Phoenix dactylifera]|uniref:Receptor-like serine/threonine-protein kinase n=1 Tax=Phoenix dactylifera TaxID=42345 RepID=A0A8B7MUZ6_PHODC|nr:G-type lectin S-receptor-like serine/threonine-protein kinase At5g35370 [Phoenix dactylifera]
MATPFVVVLLLLLYPFTSSAAVVATEFLYPNFTATVINYVDNAGVFLTSRNATFKAAIYNAGQQPSHYYLTLLHGPTSTPVWSANRNSPIPNDGLVILSPVGLSVVHPNGSLLWSTPPLPSPVRALRLLDTGNLLLVNASNASLWRSFDHPTDTLLSDQPLRAGSSLTSPVSDTNFSEGDYRLTVTTSDAVMTWKESQQYYSISTDARSFKDDNADISFMVSNSTGLYLLSTNQKVIFHVFLAASSFRIMKLDSAGRFQIISYSAANSSSSLDDKFVAPSSDCDLPFSCQTLGLCNTGANGTSCTCPVLFAASKTGGCSPADDSLLASTCGANFSISYLSPGSGIVYFANKFMVPITVGQGISACQSLCSGNCSCVAFIYRNSSRSCYLLENQLGSVFNSKDGETASSIYVKTLLSGSPQPISGKSTSRHLIPILLPTIAAFLLIIVVIFMGILWWTRQQQRKRGPSIRRSKSAVMKEIQLGRQKSRTMVATAGDKGRSSGNHESDDDDDDISILGLPTRFTYAELEAATWNFRTKIGSGGFGAVYKGELPDETLVAVKKIDNVGLQGKKEFCTEIAVIGNIRHVNLVRLRGFCAEGTKRLLVYEYMSRGSLDRSLFGVGPVLEWQERIDIAIGAARGLAYLHTGCEHKIVHCDVKPENILLDERGQARIGDFGLAKLLRPEQSGLFTTMRGTRGYLAPEWLTNSAISDWTDVYSFGMVLLELVRGRKNKSVVPSEGESESAGCSESTGSGGGGGGRYFPMVALEAHEQGRYGELADPRLEGRAPAAEVERVVRVALCCLHEEPGLRPAMGSVVAMLERTAEVGEPRVESLNFLRLYGRGFAEPAGNASLFGTGGHNIGSVCSPATATSSGSPSYLSSQQVSGPR